MVKHAILIVAHENPNSVQLLNNILRDEFDVFLHWDAKTPTPYELYEIHSIPMRFSCFWGDISVLEATWCAFGYIFSKGYDTCTVISANCIPLGTAKFIKKFIEDSNQSLVDLTSNNDQSIWLANLTLPRGAGWWTNPKGIKKFYEDKFLRFNQSPINNHRGGNWMTLRRCDFLDLADYIKDKPSIIKMMFMTYAPEETLFQYLFYLLNKKSIGNARLIIWEPRQSHPKELTKVDIIDGIKSNNYIFGRKVNLCEILKDKDLQDLLEISPHRGR